MSEAKVEIDYTVLLDLYDSSVDYSETGREVDQGVKNLHQKKVFGHFGHFMVD